MNNHFSTIIPVHVEILTEEFVSLSAHPHQRHRPTNHVRQTEIVQQMLPAIPLRSIELENPSLDFLCLKSGFPQLLLAHVQQVVLFLLSFWPFSQHTAYVFFQWLIIRHNKIRTYKIICKKPSSWTFLSFALKKNTFVESS